MIQVKFRASNDLVETAHLRLAVVADRELRRFADAKVKWLKAFILSNMVHPHKLHDDGKPTLFDSGKYLRGIKATVENGNLEIKPTGNNDHMSNEALGELLEWGAKGYPARPHWRILGLEVNNSLEALGRDIFKALLES